MRSDTAAQTMIQFSYVPPVRWLVLGALFAGAVILLSYLWAKGRPPHWLRLALAALRWTSMGLVLVCLLDPEWIEAIKHEVKSRVAVLLDTSRSMGTRDVAPNRLAAAKSWLPKATEPLPAQGLTPSYYAFSRALAPLATLSPANATGDVTGVASALESLLTLPREDLPAGVLLCSDGIDNTGQAPDAIARLYRRKGIPIHTATLGTTNDQQDIVIENVQVKRAVPNESPTKLSVLLRAFGYRDRSAALQVLLRNHVVATATVKLTDGPQTVELSLTPRERGYQVYEVRIPAQPGEWLATNNRRWFGLEVVDPTIRVVYMEGTPQQPSSAIPEWKYLKDALESDPNIKVKALYRQFGSSGQFLNTADADPETGERIYPVEHPTQGFPRTLDELLNYDVVIHSDILKSSFTADQLQNMARLVEEHGGGFVMIGGNSAFGRGGYHRTVLDRIIPVAMEQEADSQARPIRLHVPPAALAHPLIALGATPAETELIWTKKFPLLHGCNHVDRAKPGAVVLGEDESSRNAYGPRLLLAVQQIGKGRSMAFTSDTTRSWGKDFETVWGEPITPGRALSEHNCDGRYYRQFWVNAVRWLAAGRLGRTNNPVTLELARAYCIPGEKVAATVKVRDHEFNPLPGADVALLLVSGANTNAPQAAVFDRASQAYLAELAPPGAGEFTVVARAAANGQSLGEDRQLLVCEPLDRELADLRARPELMAAIARNSGGQVVSLANPAPLASCLPAPPPATIEYRHDPLWDRFWVLAVLLLLLTTEWGTRRLNGMA
jgi:uncharacterized membrane protein